MWEEQREIFEITEVDTWIEQEIAAVQGFQRPTFVSAIVKLVEIRRCRPLPRTSNIDARARCSSACLWLCTLHHFLFIVLMSDDGSQVSDLNRREHAMRLSPR